MYNVHSVVKDKASQESVVRLMKACQRVILIYEGIWEEARLGISLESYIFSCGQIKGGVLHDYKNQKKRW